MSITAILTVYKRPYSLIQQLEAIQQQSVKPAHIIIWRNAAEDVKLPYIPSTLKENLTIIDSSTNFGVWARFAVGLLANTEYVCVFDDDTIPGHNWFMNCLDTMKVKEGLLGTIGIKFEEGSQYRGKRYGWDGPSDQIEEVDIVGHAWFFKRAWLSALWQFVPDYDVFLKCGEDIAFSYMLQRVGIKTYVPPHPKDRLDMYGSHPEIAMDYGNDGKASIALTPGMIERFGQVLKYFIEVLGFKTIANAAAQKA
jgi:GT2 family glycosyltransferase